MRHLLRRRISYVSKMLPSLAERDRRIGEFAGVSCAARIA